MHHGKVRGLRECPRQVGIPIPSVTRALPLAVGQPIRFHAAAVRREVAHLGETVDLSHFVHDREPEDLADPPYGREVFVLVMEPPSFHRLLLDDLDLLAQRGHRTEKAGDP